MTDSASRFDSAVWVRPDFEHKTFFGTTRGFDTALFDVDGVLIETKRSYRLAVIHGSERLVRVVNGLTDAPSPMVTAADVALFKLAGGFNSDWDATQLFATLWTARLREWRGQPEAEVSLEEWAARASAAARAGHGGVAWLRATFPASAIPDDDMARWAHDEFYWGADLIRELFAREPQFAPEAEGFVHNEELLLGTEVLPALVAQGITKQGLITGRLGPEVGWAVTRLAGGCGLVEGVPPDGIPWYESEHGRSPFGCIVPSTTYAKPNPQALLHALARLESRAAFYVGDTADDLDLVLRYRREMHVRDASLPPVLAVVIASDDEARTYQERGADLIIPHVRHLPSALESLRSGAA
ncbi:MAG: HAD family hydrolase [Ktedonobacterales bacterium]